MGKINDIQNDIFELFSVSQKTSAVHQKNSIVLNELLLKSSNDKFFVVLKNILNHILIIEKSNQYLEKIMDFFALFCSLLKTRSIVSDDECEEYMEHPLLTKIFYYLLKVSKLDRPVIRLRSCQLINKILDRMVGVEVSEDLCNQLEETLLLRLEDPKSVIRQQAVIALHRLQDPTNPDDRIIAGFTHLMNTDSFPKVRRLCVEKLAIRKDVISYVIKRVCDVDEHVRLAAFKRLTTVAKYLKIAERRTVLHCGLVNNSDTIKEFMNETLVKNWLENYGNDILQFLESIRFDASEKDVEETNVLYDNVLHIIFKSKPLTELSNQLSFDENKLVPIHELNWVTASYWRIYVQYLSKNEEFEGELEKVLPELVFFSKYVKEYYTNISKQVTTVEFLQQQFILKQLFLITNIYDFSDVSNRQCLHSLVCNILQTTFLLDNVTEVVVNSLAYSFPDIVKRTQVISEIISDILYPMEPQENERLQEEHDFQKSQIKVRIDRLQHNLEMAISKEDFLEAEQIKNQLKEETTNLAKVNAEISTESKVQKKTDVLTTIKCLDIAAAILLSPQVTTLTVSLRTLKEKFIEDLLIHENVSITMKALKCYALCCVVDKVTAVKGIHFFSAYISMYNGGEECDTQTLLICIGAVVDLLRIYGPQLMASPTGDNLSESMDEMHEMVFAGGTSLTDILKGLVDLMNDEDYEIQERAGLAICQLILSQRIRSPPLISHLMLKWCNPATEQNSVDRLKQLIGVTLEKLPLIPECSDQLKDAVMCTIKTLVFAPKQSPLADVSVDNIAKFMLSLCKTSPKGQSIHEDLAMSICNAIREKPTSAVNNTFSKMLLMLDIPDDEKLVQELIYACDEIRDVINDRYIINNVVKFINILANKRPTNNLPPPPVNETKVDELSE